MKRWIVPSILVILALAIVASGLLYLRMNTTLNDARSQVASLQKKLTVLQSVFPKLGQEFPLSIGQSTLIQGEDLRLTFKAVPTESRCPQDVVCITQGQVVCLLETERQGSVRDLQLVQPGLYYEYSEQTSDTYKYRFKIEPYPSVGSRIAGYQYRLLLTVTK